MFRQLSTVAVAALLAASCQAGTTPKTPDGGDKAGEVRSRKAAPVALKGTVMAPAGLIGLDGAGLIGPDGSGLIGVDAASLIGHNGGQLTAGRRGLLATGEAPLKNALVYLTRLDGTPLKPAITTRTDDKGAFSLPGVVGGQYVVVSLAESGGKRAKLLTLASVTSESQPVGIDTATTLVTTTALVNRKDPLQRYDPTAFTRAVTATGVALRGEALPDLTNVKGLVSAFETLSKKDPELAKAMGELAFDAGQPTARPSQAAPSASPSATPSPTPAPSASATATPAATPAPTATPTPAPADHVANVTVENFHGTFQAGFVEGGSSGRYRSPWGLAIGELGTYVTDAGNFALRKFTDEPAPSIATLAGAPTREGLKEGPGVEAAMKAPAGVAVDPAADTVYVADAGNNVIWRWNGAELKIHAGSPTGAAGYKDGKADALFDKPMDVWFAGGALYVADTGNHRIRKVLADGTVETVAGSGTPGNTDANVTNAQFNGPRGVAVAADGSIYVADTENHRIRKILGGNVTTFAGAAVGYLDRVGTAALFNRPVGLDFTADGKLAVADSQNRRIRLIDPDGKVRTLAGNGQPISQQGNGETASFEEPMDVAEKSDGVFYVTDHGSKGNRIYRLTQKK